MPVIATSTTALLLLRRNRLRKSFVLQNQDSANAMVVKRERAETLTVSSTDFDHKLNPGGTLALNSGQDGTEAIQDSYSIIALAGTPNVAVLETEDVVR